MKLESPSAERNKLPIWQVFETKVLPLIQNHSVPLFLEIAAGAGVHTHFLAKQVFQAYEGRPFRWYPSDADASCLDSIVCHVEEDVDLRNANVVEPPVKLTFVESGIFEQETINFYSLLSFDVIVSINMIHISPWEALLGLLKFSGEKLRNKTGILLFYGPFKVNDAYSDSNRNFDTSLRQQNAQWGIRDLEKVVMEAERNHLRFLESIEMPANNLVVLFRKEAERKAHLSYR